jgi:hypothetical protein
MRKYTEVTTEWAITTSPCKRANFMWAAVDALEFLIYNVALTIFSALA